MLSTYQQEMSNFEIKPVKAIVFYENKITDQSPKISPTVHNFDEHSPNDFSISAGVPVSENDIRIIEESFTELACTANENEEVKSNIGLSVNDLIKEKILLCKANTLAWISPSRERTLWFYQSEPVKAVTPHLLFIARKKKLYVFAVKTTDITADTELFNAPFMNINSCHTLCFGSSVMPNRYSLPSIKLWEDALFDAKFTHKNHDHTLKLPKRKSVSDGAHIKFWKGRKGKKQFAYSYLQTSKLTLENILTHLK